MLGVNEKTETKLMAMPLASARPRSGPILNCMAASAIKPMHTVQPDENTATELMQHDLIMSCSTESCLPRSSLKRCSKKTEKSSAMATCRMEPAEFVTKLISPKMRLVPQLMKTETPRPKSTMTGSAQLLVVITKIRKMMAMAAAVMMLIWLSVEVVASALDMAEPVMAPSSPTIWRMASVAAICFSVSIVTLKSAVLSL